MKSKLINILINQIARHYTDHLLSYGCLNDELYIIASKIYW